MVPPTKCRDLLTCSPLSFLPFGPLVPLGSPLGSPWVGPLGSGEGVWGVNWPPIVWAQVLVPTLPCANSLPFFPLSS